MSGNANPIARVAFLCNKPLAVSFRAVNTMQSCARACKVPHQRTVNAAPIWHISLPIISLLPPEFRSRDLTSAIYRTRSNAAQFVPSKNSHVFVSIFPLELRPRRYQEAASVRNHPAYAPGP